MLLAHNGKKVDKHVGAQQVIDLVLADSVAGCQPEQRVRLVGRVVVDVHVGEALPPLADHGRGNRRTPCVRMARSSAQSGWNSSPRVEHTPHVFQTPCDDRHRSTAGRPRSRRTGRPCSASGSATERRRASAISKWRHAVRVRRTCRRAWVRSARHGARRQFRRRDRSSAARSGDGGRCLRRSGGPVGSPASPRPAAGRRRRRHWARSTRTAQARPHVLVVPRRPRAPEARWSSSRSCRMVALLAVDREQFVDAGSSTVAPSPSTKSTSDADEVTPARASVSAYAAICSRASTLAGAPAWCPAAGSGRLSRSTTKSAKPAKRPSNIAAW